MGFFCPTNANITICENRRIFGKWMHAMGVTISPHSFLLLNKTPSSTRRENVLMQKVWKYDRKENELWGGDILCFCCITAHRVALALLLALALSTELMSLGSYQIFLATCVNEQSLKNKDITKFFSSSEAWCITVFFPLIIYGHTS